MYALAYRYQCSHRIDFTSGSSNQHRRQPLFSVIWSGKNRLQWLEKEIGSVLRQSHVNWQLVVEDGGSTDGTLEWFLRSSRARQAD